MSGTADLRELLQNLSPELTEGNYVFISADAAYGELADLKPVCYFREAEGGTFIIPQDVAEAENIEYEGAFRCITLKVHSSLDAVGLTAAFAAKLTSVGISANVVAGYYHDHIFVQSSEAQRAVEALTELSSGE